MLAGNIFQRTVCALGVVGLAFAAPAFAAKDVIYPSAASATVNASSVAVTNNFVAGANGHTTLDNAVYAGDAVMVTATWSIKNNNGPGTNTSYPTGGRTVNFTASSVSTNPEPVSATVAPASCTGITSASITCSTAISLTAPASLGGYQVQITAADSVTGPGSNTNINGTVYAINFTVDAMVTQKETKLTVDPKCAVLNGDVDLTATLEELVGGAKIPGADIDFSIDDSAVGSATTDTSGVATRPGYSVTGLGVGDHNLYAEFAGDASYFGSNDSDTLGITYMFVGFQQPINPEGNSIFGGRVIPIKIKLVDANLAPVTDASPTVWLTSYSASTGLGTVLEQVSSVSAADTDNIMRYVPADQQYIYNWDATDLPNGTYAVVVDLGDSGTCRPQNPYAIITVAKKGKK